MLTWIALLALFLFSGATYAFGRHKAQRLASTVKPGSFHSLPGYHGSYVALWAGLPAALIVLAAAMLGGRMEAALLRADPPAAVSALTPQGQSVFFDDARAMAHGSQASETVYAGDLKTAIEAKAAQAKRLEQLIQYGALAAGVVVGLAGLALAYPRIGPTFRARNRVEGWIAVLFLACAVTAILTTVGIVGSLVWESWRFFQSVSPVDFLFGTQWDPQIAMRSDQYASKGAFGAVPLFAGTFLIMMIAMLVAAPIGLYSAIYLSEYANPLTRGVVKPLLEILAGVPTVVYGFFAALTV
ncbi:MAG: phosphate ABC transporter permease family protein, partial [Phenylobacterium sp.]|nr:phosphate ABC transporter permease family protein [Phenylobacterium sp.]